MINPLFRKIELCIFIMTIAVLSSSFYFQYYRGMQPCPLCIMQRLCLILLLVISLLGMFLHTIKYAKFTLCLQFFIILFGIYFSGRQVWLQLSTTSTEGGVCLPQLDILLQYFPWKDILHALFWGSGSCGEVSETWLGLSMPMWSLIYFSLLAIISCILWRRISKS